MPAPRPNSAVARPCFSLLGSPTFLLRRCLPLFVASAAVLLPSTLGASNYTLARLGPVPFGGGSITVTGMNNAGEIVGFVRTPMPGQRLAFKYSGGAFSNLGVLDETLPASSRSSWAQAINRLGRVVGHGNVSTGTGALRRLFTHDGNTLNGEAPWGGYSVGYGINDADVIAGSGISPVDLVQRAFAYVGRGSSGFVDLGTLVPMPAGAAVSSGLSNAYAINQVGDIVGDSDALPFAGGSYARHAALFRNGRIIDLGTLGGGYSSAIRINHGGMAAGYSSLPNESTQHAFVWRAGVMTDLGTLGGADSAPIDLNNHGQVVGFAETSNDIVNFIYTAADGLRNLDQLLGLSQPGQNGVLLFIVGAINDRGQIAGEGIYYDGEQSFHEILLFTPVTSGNVVAGTAEVVGPDILHPNGNVYDQVLLTGPSATLQADPGQALRCSFLDPNGDIVQCEFSGPGHFTILLDPVTYLPPAPAARYNQPGVNYVTGRATVLIDNNTAATSVNIFSVGRVTAVNQALFPAGQSYDGVADIQLLQISGPAMGALYLGNTRFGGATGQTGILAPNTAIQQRAVLHDIAATGVSTPVLRLGENSAFAQDFGSVLLAGGDLVQANAAPVEVTAGRAGVLKSIATVANIRSDGSPLPRGNVADARFTSRGTGDLRVDGMPMTLAPVAIVRELAFTAARGAPASYPNGSRKIFTANVVTLTFDAQSLFQPTPVEGLFPASSFRDAATGLVWEVVFEGGTIREINLSSDGAPLGKWM